MEKQDDRPGCPLRLERGTFRHGGLMILSILPALAQPRDAGKKKA